VDDRRAWARRRRAPTHVLVSPATVRELRPDEMPSAHAEPCVSCGEETAVGSVFFSDRRTIHEAGGATSYVCALCDQRVAAARHRSPAGDEPPRLLDGACAGIFLGREL
jgi:hypothetical protein